MIISGKRTVFVTTILVLVLVSACRSGSEPTPTHRPDEAPTPTIVSETADSDVATIKATRVESDEENKSIPATPTPNRQDETQLAAKNQNSDTPTDSEPIRQWAVDAAASSEAGEFDFSAQQITGAPDTDACMANSPRTTSWASIQNDTVEVIDAYFHTPVFASQINVVQTLSPDSVSQVALIDLDGNILSVFEQMPHELAECPFTLSINIEQSAMPIQGVRITVDQTVLEPNPYARSAAIDAVEIVGLPATGEVTRPLPPGGIVATPTLANRPELIWRKGGSIGENAAGLRRLGGVDVDEEYQLVYVADRSVVQMYDFQGNQHYPIETEAMQNAVDIKLDQDGVLYVADPVVNQIFVFSHPFRGGVALTHLIGEPGKGDGQFGPDSPKSLAIGRNGHIFVLDKNVNDADETIVQIQEFLPDGTFVNRFSIENGGFDASGIAAGVNGRLYIIDAQVGHINEYDDKGTLLRTMGGEALIDMVPKAIAIDGSNNLHIATEDDGIAVLDSDGNLVTFLPKNVLSGDSEQPAGAFTQLQGLAVAEDGQHLFVSEHSDDTTFLTALFLDEVALPSPPSNLILRLNGSTCCEVTADGDVWIEGWNVGDITPNGEIWVEGIKEGELGENGVVWKEGVKVGDISLEGQVWLEGDLVGQIDADGTIWIDGTPAASMEGGSPEQAALLLYFGFFDRFFD